MKKRSVLLSVLVVILLATIFWHMSQPAVAPVASVDILVQVGESTTHALAVPAGTTALAATRKIAEVSMEEENGLGVVTAIDGVAADFHQKQAWKLVINGSAAPVEAGAYVVQAGDKVRWVLK